MTYLLRFGDLDFSPGAQVGDVEYQVLGLSRGEIVPVTVVADSMMRDGADERVDHWENRDQSILIGIKGSDSELQALAERDLWLECQKPRNEIAWMPPDGLGATTVFDVLWAGLRFRDDSETWDLDELRGYRVWELKPRVLPFGHSEDEITDDGLAAGGTPTTVPISDGTSATDWTSPYGSVTVSSGALLMPLSSTAESTWVDSYHNTHWRYRFEGSVAQAAVDFSATPYVQVEFAITNSANQLPLIAPQAFADGSELTLLSTVYITNGLRCTYLCPDSAVSALTFKGVTDLVSSSTVPPAGSVTVDNVQRSNQPPVLVSTGRESVRTVNIRGSARTTGRISISHATSALGDVILHSCPALANGWTPDLRRFWSSGGTVTADSATVSGSRETISFGSEFTIPAAPMPRGGFLPYVRARSVSGAGTVSRSLTMVVTTQIGSTQLGQQTVTSDTVTLTETAWTLVPLQDVTLPTTDVPDRSSATVKVTLTASGSNVEYDEAWLFYAGEDSALTIVHAGSGSPSVGLRHNRLWLDSPTLDRPEHAIWLGTQDDRSDAFFADIDSLVDGWGMHPLPAGDVRFFLVTTGPANALLSVAHKAAFHTHAYQVS